MTQNDLGNALEAIGERESGTARLEEAVTAYRAALEELTRDRVPLDWAYSEHGLAGTLAALAERQKSDLLMTEAVEAMRSAVEHYQQAGEGYWLPIAQKRVTEMQAELNELKRPSSAPTVGHHGISRKSTLSRIEELGVRVAGVGKLRLRA